MMSDQGQEDRSNLTPLAAYRRNETMPSSRASFSFAPLERVRSVGNSLILPYERFRNASTTVLNNDFAQNWASGTFTTSVDDFPLSSSSSSLQVSSNPLQSKTSFGSDAQQSFKEVNNSTHISLAADDDSISGIIHDYARVFNWEIVLQLCNTHPQFVKYAGPDGWTALHHACSRRCENIEVINALLKAYPQALVEICDKGMTPLHYACRFKAPHDAIRFLLNEYPTLGKLAVKKRDAWGRTPLWYAVRYDAPPGVVETLLKIDSTAILERDNAGESPLSMIWDSWAEKLEGKRTLAPFLLDDEKLNGHENVRTEFYSFLERNSKMKVRWERVNFFLKANFGINDKQQYRMLHATSAIPCHSTLFRLAASLYPEQASEIDDCVLTESKQSALHLAALSSTSGAHTRFVIKILLQLYPDAVFIQDSHDGALPLHRIVAHKSHWIHDGIRDIYVANREAINVGDFQGRLPLHLAAAANQHSGGQGGSIILQLLNESPHAASVADASGRLPLHYFAESSETWDEEGEALYHANESAVRTRAGEYHRLPVHLAAASNDSGPEIIKRLVALHPRGLMQADRTGKLALHIACESQKAWDKGVSEIYNGHPDAIREPCTEKKWIALQYASASKIASADVISQLTTLYPEGTRRVDINGRCALHWVCDMGRGWDSGIRDVLSAHPSATGLPDKSGKLPFHFLALRFSSKPSSEGKNDPSDDDASFEISSAKSESNGDAFVDADTSQIDSLFQLLLADPSIL
jgi:ankyrin repeat protein